jgi:hypothetical protein
MHKPSDVDVVDFSLEPWLMSFNKTHNKVLQPFYGGLRTFGLVTIKTLIRIRRNWLVIITFGVIFFSHPYLQ